MEHLTIRDRMNLALIDPFQLAQDSPDALTNDLRSGHATTLRFSRKGDYLASGRVDGKVVVWDMETNGVAMKLHGHFKQIQSLSWSRCGRYLLTASQDCRTILWDLKTQERIRIVKFAAPVYMAEMHPYNRNLFVVSLFEDRPYLVDTTDAKKEKRMRLPSIPLTEADIPKSENRQATTAAIFSVLGNHIITGTSKGWINIIETHSRQIIHSTKLSPGLISLLRITTNGRQLLANSTDRIIRVVNVPDLSLITPSTDPPKPDPDPSTLAENILLTTEHKFQDLVNRLRWNHCAFSHSLTTGTADYVTASTYMKKDIYIWELRTNSLLRILENREEPAIIEWHPSKPLLAATSIETGSIQIWGIEPQQKWSALAPDFTEVTENVEYVEREDEFDTYPQEELHKRRLDREDEDVDVLTLDVKDVGTVAAGAAVVAGGGGGGSNDPHLYPVPEEILEEETFVLPMLFDIENSDDDEESIRMSTGTMRKKEVNEGKEYAEDEDAMVAAAAAGVGGKARRRK